MPDYQSTFAALLAGALLWTLLEYAMHRFLGHDRRTMPNFFSREHTRHHSEGNYFAPAWKKGFAAGVFSLAVSALARVIATPAVASAFTVGLVGMYLSYEVVHRRAHTSAGFGPYGRYLRRHHFYHHFENPKANHGVTSPFWDLIFGTYEVPGEIRVPERLAMPWLFDPASHNLSTRFAGRYRLVAPAAHRSTAEPRA